MPDHAARFLTTPLVALAIVGLVAMPGSLHADGPAAPASATPAAAPAPAPDAAPEPIPFGMKGIEAIGLKPAFDDLHLKFYGWVDQSFTWNNLAPIDRVNVGRVYDVRSNDYLLNQVTANLERPLADGKDFDIGGKVELLYGSDGRFMHSTGLLDNISGDRDDPLHGDTNNFDTPVFYVNARLPIGNGLTVKAGKFVCVVGYEVIDAPGNPLYSHSLVYGFAEPSTHTGIQLDYPITDAIGVYYGFITGWDDWFNRNNSPSHMVGVSWKATDKLTTYFNVVTGPERDHENTDYRTLFDFVGTYQITDALSISVNLDLGNENNAGAAGAPGDNWRGIAGYLSYVILPSQLNANLRYEYFRDETASRIGFTADVTELTAGLDIHPIKSFQNLRVRPEVRWDHAYGDSPFDAGTAADQVTIGADVIITY